MDAENRDSCPQKDSAEHEGYVRAHRSFNRIWKGRDSAQPELLERILDKDNLNRAYKRVKANKGAPGMDGMTIEAALPYLRENQNELVGKICRGKYTPNPVRRVEIPKPDGGMRKLGIPTVIDRIIQQAMAQQLMPIYEPVFADGSYGYRRGRSAKDAIRKVKEFAEQGYTYAVVLDLSKYFDTINHTILLNILRRNIRDERVIQMIKRYLKSGVMEDGVVTKTEEGSPHKEGTYRPCWRISTSTNSTRSLRNEGCRASVMQTISSCWRKAGGHPKDFWSPAQNILRRR